MPVFALSGFLSSLANFDLQTILIRVLVLCISLSFHEAAHAWAAFKLGDDTAALQGRLTLNPLAHLDPIGSIAFLIAGIGWAKPVPINPTRFNRKYSLRKGIVLTSVAGPSANLIMAVGSAFLYYIVATIGIAAQISSTDLLFSIFLNIFSILYSSNVILAVFNLLPIPPLDGYKVFGAALPGSLYYKIMQYERYIGLVFLFLVFFGRGVLTTILTYIRWPFDQVILWPLGQLFDLIWKLLGLT